MATQTRKNLQSLWLATFALLFAGVVCAAQQPGQAPAGGVTASEPRFRVVRSVSGTKGSQQGARYVIEDPRSIFYVPEDKQVIVYFEWDGPTGAHHFEGFWKNPEGKMVVYSDFKFEAKEKRFAAYWTLILTDQLPTGMWALEARVDGESAGVHTFQILAVPRPAEAAGPPPRHTLTTAELYQKAVASTVFIEKLGPQGEKLATGSGFFVAEGQVATAFQVIDGASSLRVVRSDGVKFTTSDVLAWNRRQDWAILRVASPATPVLRPAKDEAWSVGDRCFTLDAPAEGNRVIVEGSITGKSSNSAGGERLNIGMLLASTTTGAPVLDEYGEVIGLVGGGLIPGAWTVRGTRFEFSLAQSDIQRSELVVPMSLVYLPKPETPGVTLAELDRRGQFVGPLTAGHQVSYGSIGRRIEGKDTLPRIIDERHEFSKSDTELALVVMWDPKDKIKSTTSLRLYDIENRSLGQTQPSKISLYPGRTSLTTWKFPISQLPAGTYRLDLLLGDQPAWRTFFRIVE